MTDYNYFHDYMCKGERVWVKMKKDKRKWHWQF